MKPPDRKAMQERETNKRLRVVGLWGASLLVAGCATVAPEADRAAGIPTPAAWSTPIDPTLETETFAAWNGVVADPVLRDLIEEALVHNRDLRAAAARVVQVRALLRSEGTTRAPQLSASFGASRSGNLGTTTPGPRDGYSLGLNASWELDLWQRLADNVASQAATLRASEADLESARRALAVQVAALWFDLAETRARLELAEETATNYRANERVIERRFEAGLNRALDVRLARTGRLAAESAAADARRRIDALRRALEVLVGRYPASALEGSPRLPETPAVPATGVPGELLARRPDLRAAEARHAAAVYAAGATRKLRYPRLSLGGSIETASHDLGELLEKDLGIWNLVGNLTAPIFEAGRIEAQIDAASAAEVAALEDFAARLLVAYQETETALAAERLLADQEALVRARSEEATASERLAWSQYEKGLVGITTVLDAQRQAFEGRSQLLALRNARWQNRLSLFRALGGPPIPGAVSVR